MLPRTQACVYVATALATCVLGGALAAAEPPPACRETAALTVLVDNRSDTTPLDVHVDGELAAADATCAGTGDTSYATTMPCAGTGVVRCGALAGLRPGAWVHRVTVTVPGSATQHQAQRLVLVAGDATDVSNALVWTVFPQVFVVSDPTEASLRAALASARAYTDAHSDRFALVTFGFAGPSTIALTPHTCAADPGCASLAARPSAGLCFDGSRVVLDGLDDAARPDVVRLSIAGGTVPVLRVYGSANVFRGLGFLGSGTASTAQADTIDFMSRAAGNRIEDSLVFGPSDGDAVGACGGADGQENVVAGSTIAGAADKGVKTTDGAHVTVERSCIAGNRNGGIQATLGGHATARENVVQRNVPGPSQNGIMARSTDGRRSSVETHGNVVRFSGARGLSVSDNAEADFNDDYVADGQIRGSTITTTKDVAVTIAGGAAPRGTFRGVALVCNGRDGLTGYCAPPKTGDPTVPCTPEAQDETCCLTDTGPSDVCKLPCSPPTTARDCCTNANGTIDVACAAATTCATPSNVHFGAVVFGAAGHTEPDADFGTAGDPGGNAIASNFNAGGQGANFRVDGITSTIPAEGNQWEHCPAGALCDVTMDVSPANAPVDVGTIPDPRAPDGFHLTRVSPPRPRRGDLVRVYGGPFDAIAGNPARKDCDAVLPACMDDADCAPGPCVDGWCACDVTNGAVRGANMMANVNRIQLQRKDGTPLATVEPDAVTPTMLAFRMPFDCFAPLVLEVAEQHRPADGLRTQAILPLCDPAGCSDRRDAPCDDGDACTSDEHCSGSGNVCVPGPHISCTSACLTGACDPQSGCVPIPAGTVCRPSAGPCDVAASCDGVGKNCPPNAFRDATTVCRPGTGPCDVAETCTGAAAACPPDARKAAGAACDADDNPCTADECDGTSVACRHNPKPEAASCDDGDACTYGDACNGNGTCVGTPTTCTSDQCNVRTCNGTSSCMVTPVPIGTPCDNHEECETGDRCDGQGSCVPSAMRDSTHCVLAELAARTRSAPFGSEAFRAKLLGLVDTADALVISVCTPTPSGRKTTMSKAAALIRRYGTRLSSSVGRHEVKNPHRRQLRSTAKAALAKLGRGRC